MDNGNNNNTNIDNNENKENINNNIDNGNNSNTNITNNNNQDQINININSPYIENSDKIVENNSEIKDSKDNKDNGGNNNNNDSKDNNLEIKKLNSEYYDEFNRPKYDQIIDYENQLRKEIEDSSPLVSNPLPMSYLTNEFKDSKFITPIETITKKYKFIRTVRRDGNCFYRSYLYRLFEHIVANKEKVLCEKITKLVTDSKTTLENNGYEWMVIEDFYNMFISELKLLNNLDPCNKDEYLKLLFEDKEKCNYLIAYIRMYICAYIKENRFLYENYIFDEDLDTWCRREVEPIDVECDHLQVIAITNCFGVGVVIEYLNEKSIDTMKFPEEGGSYYFTKMFFRPGHYDILYDE